MAPPGPVELHTHLYGSVLPDAALRRLADHDHQVDWASYEEGFATVYGTRPHPGGAGLPAWTATDRSLVGTEVMVWHTFGVTHVSRPEDWPVMPVESAGFQLVPSGFFGRSPALDLPPPDHCDG